MESVITDRSWLEGEFCSLVQKRGSAIIEARGKSSAASAANAAIDAMSTLQKKTVSGDLFSAAVFSAGNPYGIDEELIFSFPCVSAGDGNWSIVEGLEWDGFLEEKIRLSEKELKEERDCVKHLLA